MKKIDDFWSYSRHGSDYARTALLLLHYNGLQTAVGGVIVAVVCACLLPLDWVRNQHVAAILVMLVADWAALVLMLTCVVSRRVFLDFARIPQDDEDAKRRGILSLGHTLKCSDRMLCIVDETYWTRLWCVFECAAYLKLTSNGEASQKLQVLPMPSGPLTLGTFLSISLLAGRRHLHVRGVHRSGTHLTEGSGDHVCIRDGQRGLDRLVLCLAHGGLKQARALMNQRAQFRDFSLRGANCFCCAVKHVHPKTGIRMGCDRVQIEASVVAWFGCIETFESYVRDTLHDHAQVRSLLPYRHCALAGLPWFFCSIGGAVWLLRSGADMETLYFFVDGASDAFISVPLITRIVLYSFHMFQPKSATRWSLFCAMWRCTAFCGLVEMVFVVSKTMPALLVGKITNLVVSSIFCLGLTAFAYRHDV